jgi:hypothetical protein
MIKETEKSALCSKVGARGRKNCPFLYIGNIFELQNADKKEKLHYKNI